MASVSPLFIRSLIASSRVRLTLASPRRRRKADASRSASITSSRVASITSARAKRPGVGSASTNASECTANSPSRT